MEPNSEQIIMHKINELNNLFLTTIEFILEETKNIETDISNISIDNNYFTEHHEVVTEFHNLFNFHSLHKFKCKLSQYYDIINNIKINECDHEWIDDYIDINCEKSMSITYCKKCETSKE
jgi:hypothetical protein